MARITVEDCVDKFESRFELVLVASNRARKLHSGESPTVEKDNDKNTVIGLREIADETIKIEEMKNSLVEEYQTVSYQNEEDLSLEYADSENQNDDEIQNIETEDQDDQKEIIAENEDTNISGKNLENEISEVNENIEIENEVSDNENIKEEDS